MDVAPTSCALLRAEPDGDAARLDCIPAGTTVTSSVAVPFWREVRLDDGRRGWIAKRFLELVDAAAEPAPGPDDIPPNAWLELHMIDVGQGDALLLLTPDDGIEGNGRFEGRSILIDAGPVAKTGDQHLWQYVENVAHRGARLDALVISHPHTDHYGGGRALLQRVDIARFYDAAYPDSDRIDYSRFLDGYVRREAVDGIPVRLFRGREEFDAADWGSELRVEALWSWPGSADGLGSGGTRINNSSLVLRLTYGDVSFLLTGDLEGKDRGQPSSTTRYGEARLLADGPPERLRSTVLKLAHHGSETSTTDAFLDAVQPRYVLISSGRQSFHGTFLPDASVLQRVCRKFPEVAIYRTDWEDQSRTESNDADGDHVIVRTNGRVVEVLNASRQPAPLHAC